MSADIGALLHKQKEFFYNQQTKSLSSRVDSLHQLKKTIQDFEKEIYRALELDLGKPAFESYATEIGFILDEISHTIKALPSWMKPVKVSTPAVHQPAKSTIYSEPYGQVLIIAPWNYPFQLTFSPLVGAIAAGNTVIVKPSEFTPNTSKVVEKIIQTCFDDRHCACVQGDHTVSQKLLEHKFDYIFFTGSTRVGRIIMQKAANFLTPVTLELGGKSPCIIDSEANIKTAAKRVAWGKFLNAGQTCIAPDYGMIHQDVFDEFKVEFQNAVQEFYGSDPLENSDFTKIVNESHLKRLEALVEGGEVVFGGRSNIENRKLEPTLIENPKLEHSLMQDEIFGPIFPILKFKQIDEVVDFVQSRPKPLALYYFGEDNTKIDRVLGELSFGGGCINDTLVHIGNSNLPFGGVGESGIGSYHGIKSFETFSHKKSVLKKAVWPDIPIRYAPYKDKVKFLKIFFN